MHRPRLPVLLAVLALIALAAVGSAQAAAPAQTAAQRRLADARRASLAPEVAQAISATYNTAFTAAFRAHFGDPAKGNVRFEDWNVNTPNPNDTLDPADIPTSARGCAHADLLWQVKRVLINSVQVLDADTGAVVASSPAPLNSSGRRFVELCTASFNLTTAPLRLVVRSNSAIRWQDDTLTSSFVLESTVDTNQNALWSAAFGV